MYYPNSTDSKEMSDMVHAYMNRVNRYGKTYSTQCLFENIRELLIEYTYYVPQSRLGLAEEDSSAFVIYVMENLENTLAKYRTEANDFYAYYSAVLDNKVRTFYRNKRSDENKEKSAVVAQSLLEYKLFPDNNSSFSVSENSASGGGTKMAQKLRFLALVSKTTQRRLFIYLISISPFVPTSTIKDLCLLLEIDWRQTNKLLSYIEKHYCEYTERYNLLTSRRDRLFCRSLQLEREINVHSFYCDYSKANIKLLRLQKIRKEIENKNLQIKRTSLHINYSSLAKILNITKQSVASSAFYSKNLLSWCQDFNSVEGNCNSTGLSQKLINKLVTGRWEQERVKVTHLSVLYPERIFSINYKLNV